MERSGELRTKRDIFQLGRKNLTDAQKTYLIGRQYEAQKMTVGGDRKSKAQNGLLIKGDTAETIAKEHNIGRNTVKRAEKFVKGVDAAEKINSGTQKVKNRPRCCSTEDGYKGQQTDVAYCPPIITNAGGKSNAKKSKYARRVGRRQHPAAA